MSYYPVQNQSAGEALSRALWDVCCPPATRQPGDATVMLGLVVEGAGGQWWMQVPDSLNATVSPLLDEATLTAAADEIERAEDFLP